MGKYPDRDYTVKGLGERVDKLEDDNAALEGLGEALEMIRKGYKVAKRYGPPVILALAGSNIFGSEINNFLSTVVTIVQT